MLEENVGGNGWYRFLKFRVVSFNRVNLIMFLIFFDLLEVLRVDCVSVILFLFIGSMGSEEIWGLG